MFKITAEEKKFLLNRRLSLALVKDVDDIEDKWEDKVDDIYLTENGHIVIEIIVVGDDNRGKGIGSKIIQDVIKYANKVGKIIELIPAKKGYKGATSTSRLIKFYNKFGFVLNKGKKKHPSIQETNVMYRLPHGANASIKQAWKKDGYVELVPIKWLSKFREYDKKYLRKPETIKALKVDIKKNGLKEPLILRVGEDDSKALLVEGNHRLVALEELGEKFVPIKLWITSKTKGSGSGNQPVKVKLFPYEKWVHSNRNASDLFPELKNK